MNLYPSCRKNLGLQRLYDLPKIKELKTSKSIPNLHLSTPKMHGSLGLICCLEDRETAQEGLYVENNTIKAVLLKMAQGHLGSQSVKRLLWAQVLG